MHRVFAEGLFFGPLLGSKSGAPSHVMVRYVNGNRFVHFEENNNIDKTKKKFTTHVFHKGLSRGIVFEPLKGLLDVQKWRPDM